MDQAKVDSGLDTATRVMAAERYRPSRSDDTSRSVAAFDENTLKGSVTDRACERHLHTCLVCAAATAASFFDGWRRFILV